VHDRAPGKPAESEPGASPPIRGSSHSPAAAIFTGFFGVLGLLAFAMLLAIALKQTQDQAGVYAAALLFALTGIAFAAWSVQLMRRYLRYRHLALYLDPYPGAVGGEVAGTVEVPIAHNARQTYKVVLSAARYRETSEDYTDSDGKTRTRTKTDRTLLWQDEASADAEHSPAGTRLKFRFSVPRDAPESEEEREDKTSGYLTRPARVSLKWELRFQAAVPGVDLDETFVIPVRKAAGP
jgi:hypothetical protein